jgi:hypothetical protein
VGQIGAVTKTLLQNVFDVATIKGELASQMVGFADQIKAPFDIMNSGIS